MIVLFTDFGLTGPYCGQMRAVIYGAAPDVAVIDLFANAPSFEPLLAGHLLAAYVNEFSAGTVFLCVVDPGVGSAARRPVVAEIDGCYFVGPDNGLFDVVAGRATFAAKREILWQPQRLSATFHGRDIFAPVAARIATGTLPDGWLSSRRPYVVERGAGGLSRVIYIDGFGNAMTGLRAGDLGRDALIEVGGRSLFRARTFADVPRGEPFWYQNANGLVEVAVNCGSAEALLSVRIGDQVCVSQGGGYGRA